MSKFIQHTKELSVQAGLELQYPVFEGVSHRKSDFVGEIETFVEVNEGFVEFICPDISIITKFMSGL